VQDGSLVRVRFGTYATAAAVASARDNPVRAHTLQVAAAVASMGRSPYVASHESAALIHGLSLLKAPPDGALALTHELDQRVRGRRAEGLSVYAAALPARHVMTVDGIQVTTPARTVADLARSLPFMDAVVVADCAIHKVKASKERILRVLRECDRWPGAVGARRVVDFSNGLSESVLESCARVSFHEYGLPEPRLQAEFFDDYGGVLARTDFFWPEQATVAEADGMLKYTGPEVLRDQFKRDRSLRERGYKVVHFTWQELFADPERVIASIREAFRSESPW